MIAQQNITGVNRVNGEAVNFFTLQHQDGRIGGYINITSPAELQVLLAADYPGWFVVNAFKLTDEQAEQLQQFEDLPPNTFTR